MKIVNYFTICGLFASDILNIFNYYLLVVDSIVQQMVKTSLQLKQQKFLPGLMTLPEGLVIRSSLPSKCLIGI